MCGEWSEDCEGCEVYRSHRLGICLCGTIDQSMGNAMTRLVFMPWTPCWVSGQECEVYSCQRLEICLCTTTDPSIGSAMTRRVVLHAVDAQQGFSEYLKHVNLGDWSTGGWVES